MKGFIICVSCFILLSLIECSYTSNSKKNLERNYQYEAYCDSIWDADKDFYLDVLAETQEYQDYLEQHGEWWHE